MTTTEKALKLSALAVMLIGLVFSASAQKYQEPPKCGDDRYEFLIEEFGQSPDGEYRAGDYACATRSAKCVVTEDGTTEIFEEGEKLDTESVGENYGRLKEDREVCLKPSSPHSFDQGAWVDQDYNFRACDTNTLFEREAVRWVTSSYVDKYPFAVSNGIDDDVGKGLSTKPGVSLIDTVEPESYDGQGTPVSTGKEVGSSANPPSSLVEEKVATKGFCLGDDAGEYLVTQVCSTGLCDTDLSVVGAAKNPESCVLDSSEMTLVTDTGRDRSVYREGRQVKIDLGPSKKTMGCYGGIWFSKWPVSFQQDSMEVKKGSSVTANFEIINVREEEKTFEVELEGDEKFTPFAEFHSQNGDSFTTTVPARSSKSFSLEIYGGAPATVDSGTLRVQATSSDRTLDGEDSMTVDVVRQQTSTSGGDRSVPGIGMVQLVALTLLSSIIFFLKV